MLATKNTTDSKIPIKDITAECLERNDAVSVYTANPGNHLSNGKNKIHVPIANPNTINEILWIRFKPFNHNGALHNTEATIYKNNAPQSHNAPQSRKVCPPSIVLYLENFPARSAITASTLSGDFPETEMVLR